MPNIKSAIKRVKVTEKKNLRNRIHRTILKTNLKKYQAVIDAKDIAAAEKMLPITSGAVDRALSKGVIHRNAAARKKAQIAKRLNALKAAR